MPPDLDDLDEEDQVREVYAWAGLALYMAQVVEHGLVNLLLMARLSDPGLPVEFASTDEFFTHHFRQVMGRLANAVRMHVDVPGELDQRLAEALRLRNFVVHGFFRERLELFVSQEGRRLMLAELSMTVHELRRLDAELEELVIKLGIPHGVSRARLAEKVAEMQQKAQPPS
jgi:hypothetical protein